MPAEILRLPSRLPRTGIARAPGAFPEIVIRPPLIAISSVLVTSRRFIVHVARAVRKEGRGQVALAAGEIAPATLAILQAGLAHAAELAGLRPTGAMPAYLGEILPTGILVTATLVLEGS
jgi:hypothetical protein